MLAPLGYYGGPTQTMPLVSGSPAIGAAEFYQNGYPNPSSISSDQRGRPIQSGGNIDIGAFQDVPILITIAGDGPDQEGDLSVQDATNTAAAEGGNPTIGFAPSSFNAGDNAPA